MTPERERLKAAVETRAAELRLRLNQVAKRADMSEANFFRIRSGENALTPLAVAALEHALDWEPGSIQAILDGGAPTPRRQDDIPPMPPGIGIDPNEWAKWSPEDRELVLLAIRHAQQRAQKSTDHHPGSAA